LQQVKNDAAFDLKEVVTTILGRCYQLCPRLRMPIEEMLLLKLNASMKYKLFVHQQNEELWISGNNYFPMDTLKLVIGKAMSNSSVSGLNFVIVKKWLLAV
jgi:hypothetical protein